MGTCKKVIVYYFTGTENSGNVAEWFTQVTKENNVETQIINIV